MIEPTRGGGGAGSDLGGVGGRAMTLPQSWAKAPLGNLCEKLSDGSHNPPKAQETGLPMLSARNINYRKITFDEFRLISPAEFAEEDRRTRVSSGDILLTIVGVIGRTAVVPQGSPQFTLQRSVAVLKPKSSDPRYLSYALEAPALQKYLQDNAKGTAQKGIYLKALAGVEIPIAPEAEQKRIADKLDTVLTRVDAVNTRLARVAPLLKRFRQSVLAAATSGRLTEDWHLQKSGVRTDGLWSVPDGWKWVRAEELCEFITKGTTPPKEAMFEGEGEIPYIKVYNLKFDGTLDFTIAPTYITKRVHEGDLKRSRCLPNDVLMNIVGPPLGKVSVVPDSFAEWNINQAIARFRPVGVQPAYLSICLRTPALIAHAVSRAKATAGQFNLTLEICRDLPIALPNADEQTEIVRRVETLFAFADRLEARLAQAQTAATRLTPALLAKAFRGELVPQDPNDEPAAELLRRLQAERATVPKASAGRGRKAAVRSEG